MNMKKKLTSAFLFCLATVAFAGAAFAQALPKLAGSKVTGTLLDQQQKPLDYASVSLLKGKDSSLVKTAFSDQDGKYQFELLPQGEYVVSATMVGFKKVYSKKFQISESALTVNLGTMTLTTETKTLKEVSIVAQKPFIERKMDKLV